MKKKISVLLLLIVSFNLKMVSRERSKYLIFINSGISFPLKPKGFPENWYPTYVIGGGLGISLSNKLTLQGSFNYYSFSPKQDYVQYFWIGDYMMDVSDWNWYIGDHFNSFYNLLFGLKFFFNRNRFSPYISGNLGITMHRRVVGGYSGIDGKALIIGTSLYFSVGEGIGLEYRLNKKFRIFIEVECILYPIYDDKVDIVLTLPLKTGITFCMKGK